MYFSVCNSREAKQMRDYGKSIPWPAQSIAIGPAYPKLKAMFNRWWAWMILRKVPQKDWPQLRLKVAAASALRKQRTHYGQERKWEGNYLARPEENPDFSLFSSSLNNIRNSDRHKMVRIEPHCCLICLLATSGHLTYFSLISFQHFMYTR